MKTMTDPLSLPVAPPVDLYTATEELRAADFPGVAADLLRAVLLAEDENLDNRVGAGRAVSRAVEEWFANNPNTADRGDQS